MTEVTTGSEGPNPKSYSMSEDPKYAGISQGRKIEIEHLVTTPGAGDVIQTESEDEAAYAEEMRTMAEISNGIVPITQSPATWMPQTTGDFERIAGRMGMWESEAKALKERAKVLTEEYQRHAKALRSRYYLAFKAFFEDEKKRLKLKSKSLKILTAQLGTQAKGGNVVFVAQDDCEAAAITWLGTLVKELAEMTGEDEIADMPEDLKWLLRHHSAENRTMNISVGYLVSGLKDHVKAVPISVVTDTHGNEVTEYSVIDSGTGDVLDWLAFAPQVDEFYIRPFQKKEERD